jgi:hypothetical protein
MKCETGFVLAYDENLKRMIPFFLKVRSSDIVKNTSVDIYSALTNTSGRWDLTRQENDVDGVVYEFTADWESDTDPNGGLTGSRVCKGSLTYYMYNDGRYEIHGHLRMCPVSTEEVTSNMDHHVYSVYLPFAFTEEHPMIRVGWAYGNSYELAIASQVDDAKITDLILNSGSTDTNEYPFLLKINVFDSGAGASALDALRKLADPDYNDLTIHDYIQNAFPVRIDYCGYWRAHAADVDDPTSYDEQYSKDYLTACDTNMLTKPSLILGENVEYLPIDTPVRCSGYYTLTGETTWLYVTHAATNMSGYIPLGEVKVS